MRIARFLTAVVLQLSAVGVSAATVYDVAADFSIANNPNSVWTYGETVGFGGTFTQFVTAGTLSPSIDYWRGASAVLGTPAIYRNHSAVPVIRGSVSLGPLEAGFHPGPVDRDTTYRFTAPTTSLYSFDGRFFGQDTQGTTTVVGIFINSIQQGGTISIIGFGAPSTQSRVATYSLAAGDHLDISVANGGGVNTFLYDSTGLSVTIAAVPVPEPMTVAMLLAGLGVVGFAARRRQR